MVLSEPSIVETIKILTVIGDPMARHHKVRIDELAVRTSVKAAEPLEGCFPAKAIALLDTAASKAALGGRKTVVPDDIYVAAGGFPVKKDKE